MQDSIIACHGTRDKIVVARDICWLPPTENVVKLNVDGSSSGNLGKSGFGGLFRNMHGE